MKRYEYKLFDMPPTDLEGLLNKEGQVGWRPIHPIGTPQGMKFLMERISDEDVSPEDIAAHQKAVKEAELAAKFGIGTTALPSGLLVK